MLLTRPGGPGFGDFARGSRTLCCLNKKQRQSQLGDVNKEGGGHILVENYHFVIELIGLIKLVCLFVFLFSVFLYFSESSWLSPTLSTKSYVH